MTIFYEHGVYSRVWLTKSKVHFKYTLHFPLPWEPCVLHLVSSQERDACQVVTKNINIRVRTDRVPSGLPKKCGIFTPKMWDLKNSLNPIYAT